MAERALRSETLRAGAPLTVGPVTLVPIERVVVRAVLLGGRAWVFAAKEPCALVVRDGGGTRVVPTGDVAVSLERLREALPGLDAAPAGT